MKHSVCGPRFYSSFHCARSLRPAIKQTRPELRVECVACMFVGASPSPIRCVRNSNKFMARHWAQHQVLESFASHSRSLVYWFSSLTQRNGKTCSENLFFCFKILSHRFLDFYSPNANTRWRVVAYGNTGESFSFVVHPSKHLNIIIHSNLQITRSKKRENK